VSVESIIHSNYEREHFHLGLSDYNYQKLYVAPMMASLLDSYDRS